jgi:hypothetical protein
MDQRTRDLRNLCEPIGANVYFAPEAHANYATLGLAGYGPGYFCSRGASLGKPSGLVVTATFGVFSPAVVVPAVEVGWSKTTPAAMLEARYAGATASLRRLLPDIDLPQVERSVELLLRGLETAEGAGHALYSGLRSLPFPADPIGRLWRCCDMVREHRGDSHIAVWTGAMVRPVEIQLMSDVLMGIPLKSFSVTRGWTQEQMDTAIADMQAKGWLDGAGAFTPEGRAFRDRIEADTDAMEVPIVDAIGADLGELLGLLRPWAAAIMEAGIAGGGYPGDATSLNALAR